MTPQSPFMVVAPIRHGQIDALCQVLRGMTKAPGIADPDNALIPFGRFDRLHFARLVVLEDATLADRAVGGAPTVKLPVALAFLGDCDGPADAQIAAFVGLAEPGLRTIFAHCEDYDDATDLVAWMQARSVVPATFYANWVGRTVRQVHQEAALHQALRERLALHAYDEPPQAVRAALLDYVTTEQHNGRLKLSPPEPTPPGWQVRQVLDLIWVPLVLLLLLPVFIVAAVPFLIVLRQRERTDTEIFPRPTVAHESALAALEDHDVTNQFSAFGSRKPGAFRLWLLRFLLWVVQVQHAAHLCAWPAVPCRHHPFCPLGVAG